MSNENIAAFLENYNKWRRGDESIEMPKPQEIGEALDCAVAYLRHDDEVIEALKNDNSTIKIGKYKIQVLEFEGENPPPPEVWISLDSGEAGAFSLKKLETAIDKFYEEYF